MNTKRIVFLLLLLAMAIAPASALAESKTFAVLPFDVNGPQKYAYLGKGVQDMLNTRLHWEGHFTKVATNETLAGTDAVALMDKLGVDYLVWGSLTIMGEDCSLDVQVQGRDGEAWPKSVQTNLDELIPTLSAVANNINSQVFGRPDASSNTADDATAMNPDLVYNEDGSKNYHLNPQFRYAGDVEEGGDRLRSRSLPFTSVGMVVGDADADGLTDVILLTEHKVMVMQFDSENHLVPKAEYEVPLVLMCLNLNLIDLNGNGYKEIVVSTADTRNNPKSFILEYKDGKLNLVDKGIPLFLSVARTPPDFMPTLVASVRDRSGLFKKGVYKVHKTKGEYETGGKLSLPSIANCFNFTYLPYEGDYLVVITDDEEHLRVFNSAGNVLAKTDNIFSGSSTSVQYEVTNGGVSDPLLYANNYYIPKRAIPYDLDGDGKFELLVNHPVSVAAQFFERYRFYPQGEIHSLHWDGVGLNLTWKTRRIKGSVVDYGMEDLNNDGIMDLYVCLNTHPGAAGTGVRKTIVLGYPLDASSAGGGSDVDSSFVDEAQ